MGFRIGQEVICIKECVSPNKRWEKLPKKGEKYTVRKYWLGKKGVWLILLNELVNPEGNNHELSFWAARFRSVTKTDISIFTRMLTSKEFENV